MRRTARTETWSLAGGGSLAGDGRQASGGSLAGGGRWSRRSWHVVLAFAAALAVAACTCAGVCPGNMAWPVSEALAVEGTASDGEQTAGADGAAGATDAADAAGVTDTADAAGAQESGIARLTDSLTGGGAGGTASGTASSGDALADGGPYDSLTLDELKKLVEQLEAQRDSAQALRDDCERRIAENQQHLTDVEQRLPQAEGLAGRAVVERYKIQQHQGSLLEAVVSATDFNSFLAGLEYIEAASRVSVDHVLALREERAACQNLAEQLAVEKENAQASLEGVSDELQAATAARDEAQRKADLVANAHLAPDGANWNGGKDAFVAEWGKRIDRFLSGSPMSGQGKAFAEAAWKNHIDPRFSPAISTIESGNGRACIRPHNAWGWGAAEPNPAGLASSWSSWGEAINAHVRGLARGYGYTVSPEGARKYCPPNWELWYATVVSEMNRI